MRSHSTAFPEVLIIEPKTFPDARGVFLETWERDRYAALGMPAQWRQENLVRSRPGVLRGMHFQQPAAQHKLISVLEGEIFDVAVDVRRGSPTFGRWVGVCLSGENHRQLSIPVGFAHGYMSMRDSIVSYKCSERYEPAAEQVLRWDDPRVGIEWPSAPEIVAPRDQAGLMLDAFDASRLPSY